jgi:alpha-glucosidase
MRKRFCKFCIFELHNLNQPQMNKKLLLMALIALISVSCSKFSSTHWELSSPGNNLSVQVMLGENGSLFYHLKNQGRTVIGDSPLGMAFAEALFFDRMLFVEQKQLFNQHDHYTLHVGKKLENHPEWNEMTLSFRNSEGNPLHITFRMFDTGLAFRYFFDDTAESAYTLVQEYTGFQIPSGSHGWMHPYDTISQWAPAYETYYEHKLAAGTPAPAGKNGWAFPMLFHTGQDWLLITEADMMEGYTGMYVDRNPAGGLYRMILPLEEEAMGVCNSQPVLNLPFRTPWRVVIAGDHPGVIVESNLVFDVSTPGSIGEDSWVKPGRSSWSWWAESDSPRDFNRMKQYIDFTSRMGWEYFLVDANWNEMKDGDLKQLTAYAASKGVGITAWYNSGGPHNIVTEQPRDLMHLQDVRRKEFEKLVSWGVKGIKVDFFQSDKHCIMQQYHDILKDAADFKILVNVHGATIPRGWERTYPNLVSMESVRGCEVYKFGSDFPQRAPVHNAILPFTRNVIGSMDYTPVAFSASTYPKLTTHGHELALAVLFESGIQHFADSDHSYLSQPDYVLEYLMNVPATWDETRFVAGYPGELAVVARRKGDTWYMSGISGLNENLSQDILLNFLGKGSYQFHLITDGDADGQFRNEILDVENGSAYQLEFKPRGGFAAVITRK